MSASYRTLRRASSDEFIINKRRFIGYAAPCTTEEEALEEAALLILLMVK